MPPVKNPVEYREAHEVQRIADDLIDAHYTDLATARIKYVFRSQTPEQRGKEIWGKARKIGGLNAYLAGKDNGYEQIAPEPFFVIEISEPVWLVLEDKQKRALVDHELAHLNIDPDNGKYSLYPHDLEEFSSIVRRHGLWRDDVKAFIKAAAAAGKGKLPLFDEDHAGKTLDQAINDEINHVRAELGEQVMDQVADQISAGALGSNVTAIKTRRR